ncbi:hypothetical protein ACFE04_020771 [Oxalis oulophora]
MYDVDDETMCCFFASMFVHGFCLPCCPFVERLLTFFDVAPSQIAIGGWIFIIAFVFRCLEVQLTPSLELFSVLFMSSFLYSTLRITRTTLGQRLFGPIISKFSDNRERFFFLKKAGWVDGCLAPSAQDYLVSKRNAFFFCAESQNFMPFAFPGEF